MKVHRRRLVLSLLPVLALNGCASRIGVIMLAGPEAKCLAKTDKIVVDIKPPYEQYNGMAWVIHNSCPIDRRVKISDFQQEGNSVGSPVTCGDGQLYVDVPKGKVRVIACYVDTRFETQREVHLQGEGGRQDA